MESLKIISYNVNGTKTLLNVRRYDINWKKERVDIAFSEETHQNQHGHEKLDKLASAQVFHSSHTPARQGVAILIRTHHAFQVEKVSPDSEVR